MRRQERTAMAAPPASPGEAGTVVTMRSLARPRRCLFGARRRSRCASDSRIGQGESVTAPTNPIITFC
jgi:hypothetical protein